MPVLASLLAAFIPMAIYLYLLWYFDKYEREPVYNVLKHFLWGAVGAVIIAFAFSNFLSFSMHKIFHLKLYNSIFETIIIAPIVEELAKGSLLIFTVRSKNFDSITDGLLYGGAIGLGFGMTENFLYFLTFGVNFQSWLGIVLVRTMFSAVMHCIATGTLGAFLAMAKFNLTYIKSFLPIAGLSIAIFIHFMWNLSVSFRATYVLGLIFMFLIIIFFILLFILSLSNERKIILNELASENDISLIPDEHLAILSSIKRNKKGWIDESLRKEYVKYAVRLAFRKHQLKYSKSKLHDFYEKEVKQTKEKLVNVVNKIKHDFYGENN